MWTNGDYSGHEGCGEGDRGDREKGCGMRERGKGGDRER
jgi:hypothetical protein